VWNILVSNENLSDKKAYNIFKTIFEGKADLVACTRDEFPAREPEARVADPLPSGGGEVLHRARVKLK
jgi:hypothetical protein